MIERRIYVACLAAYNNGVLHGRWIDATTDADEMQEAVWKMLKKSPYPNIQREDYACLNCRGQWSGTFRKDMQDRQGTHASRECPHCGSKNIEVVTDPYPSAEEFAIHDSEGLGTIGEYTSLAEIAEIVEFFEACDDAGMPDDLPPALLSHTCGDLQYAKTLAEEGYRGVHEKFEDYAADLFDEIHEIPASIAPYIDYEKWARDLILGGDYFTLDIDSGEAVFDNHV